MSRTYTSQINAINVLSIDVDSTASTASLTYEVGTAVQTPIITNGQQTGTETSFTAIPQAANGTSVSLTLSDTGTLGAQKQALVLLALQVEGLTPGTDSVL